MKFGNESRNENTKHNHDTETFFTKNSRNKNLIRKNRVTSHSTHTKRDILFKAFEHLLRVQGECSSEIHNECGSGNLTMKQIEYLKIMDTHKNITFSRLAEITRTSKPTVSELINKLTRLHCVYKKKSPDDKRVSFIRLTNKGKGIARTKQTIMMKVVDRIIISLDDKEVEVLIRLFNKVK